jgi:hypothetical protein
MTCRHCALGALPHARGRTVRLQSYDRLRRLFWRNHPAVAAAAAAKARVQAAAAAAAAKAAAKAAEPGAAAAEAVEDDEPAAVEEEADAAAAVAAHDAVLEAAEVCPGGRVLFRGRETESRCVGEQSDRHEGKGRASAISKDTGPGGRNQVCTIPQRPRNHPVMSDEDVDVDVDVAVVRWCALEDAACWLRELHSCSCPPDGLPAITAAPGLAPQCKCGG